MRASHIATFAAMALATANSLAQVKPVAPEQLFERLAPSVWTVETLDAKGQPLALGSAVVVGPGSLVTNCHVLVKASRVSVTRENVSYGATLEHPDPERDLCMLKVRNFSAPAVTVGHVEDAKVGSRVYAIGSPRGMEQTISDGLLSGVRRSSSGDFTALQITVPISKGSSGGGLFDAQGRLIGITTFQLRDAQNLNFALPANWIAEVPQRAKEALAARPVPVSSPAATAVASAKFFEYQLRESLTGNTKPVVYRLDRVEGDQQFFNQGTRVEKDDGEVVSIDTVIGGEYEQGMPPGGWYRGQPSSGAWDLRYTTKLSGATVKMDLRAEVVGEVTLRLEGRDLRTKHVQFRGYTTRGAMPNSPTAHYAASVWYAPELGRVVLFQVKSRSSGAVFIEETLALVRMR